VVHQIKEKSLTACIWSWRGVFEIQAYVVTAYPWTRTAQRLNRKNGHLKIDFGNRGDAMQVATIRLVSGVVASILAVIPLWKIFSKAGFSGWLALLTIIPLVNLIILYYVGFSKWKIDQTPNL
jgi:hypothetical protein